MKAATRLLIPTLVIHGAGVMGLASVTGCYGYRPVSAVEAPTGRRVRVTLSDAGTTELAAHVGPSTATISGRVIQNAADAYVVSVLETRTRAGREADWDGEHVSIPRHLVRQLEERHFSRKRTVVATIGLVALVAVVREAFWGPGGTFGGAPPGGNPGPR